MEITTKTTLLTLPPEIRNQVYSTVIANTPGVLDRKRSPFSGEFSLCPLALAKVNRQLRHEVLPMWYHERSFGIRIYPKTHSEADQVWQGFLDRFTALSSASTAHGSRSYLSHIQRLEVELWHPAYDFSLYRRELSTRGISSISRGLEDEYNRTGEYPLGMCNGIYLQFGPVKQTSFHRLGGHDTRVGGDDTNWMDRDEVQLLLCTAIVRERRFSGSSYHTDEFGLFWETFPFDRLVDLAMMIAAECKGASRLVHLRTSFAPV